jgi:hypothetical protein
MRVDWGILSVLFAVVAPTAADDAIAGRVLGIDGRPATGAVVALVEEGRPLSVPGGRLDAASGSPRAEADREGRFRLPKPAGRYAVLALDARGVAIRTAGELAESPDVPLRPWARVVGTARLGARPDAGRSVSLRNGWEDAGLSVDLSAEARADARGRFAFDRAWPGLVVLARSGLAPGGMTSDLRWADVESGGSADVVVVVGRPVEGRLDLPEGAPAPQFTSGRAVLARALPPIPLPPEWATWPAERKLAWRVAWDHTPEGAAHLRSQNRHVGAVRDTLHRRRGSGPDRSPTTKARPWE